MSAPARARLVGRPFVSSGFDYLLIGGGLSLVVAAFVASSEPGAFFASVAVLPYVILLSNSAHFASSTVRLYTKPDAFRSWPVLTMVFPLIALLGMSLVLLEAERLGPHLWALYMTWSPYHYAAQAYGLAVMYCYRSGCGLSSRDKRLLRWTALLPFFYVFINGASFGLAWIVPRETLAAIPGASAGLGMLSQALWLVSFAAPILLFVKVTRSESGTMPLIAPLILVVNGVWWLFLGPIEAFVWATIFHGIQYLAIVVIFHVRDQTARPDNRHSRLHHVVRFYGMSALLGYALFHALPAAYQLAGFGMVESILVVTAVINVHHFVVDGFIWKLKKADSNRRVVDAVFVPTASPA